MARLAAEIHLRSERYAKRPKRKFVSASTTEYAWAGYLRAWVDRVERVGNLNYPDEARRRKLAGTLVISVAIRRDGSVERADVIQSSGIKLLDAAAMRIEAGRALSAAAQDRRKHRRAARDAHVELPARRRTARRALSAYSDFHTGPSPWRQNTPTARAYSAEAGTRPK